MWVIVVVDDLTVKCSFLSLGVWKVSSLLAKNGVQRKAGGRDRALYFAVLRWVATGGGSARFWQDDSLHSPERSGSGQSTSLVAHGKSFQPCLLSLPHSPGVLAFTSQLQSKR